MPDAGPLDPPGARPNHGGRNHDRPDRPRPDPRPGRPRPLPAAPVAPSFGVYARLAALEEELQESRQLNRRITELVDVVAELLVPIADRDEERVQEVLAQYRASI